MTSSGVLAGFQIRQKAAVLNDLVDEAGESGGLEGPARSFVGDDTGGKIHANLIAAADGLGGLGTLQNGQSWRQ